MKICAFCLYKCQYLNNNAKYQRVKNFTLVARRGNGSFTRTVSPVNCGLQSSRGFSVSYVFISKADPTLGCSVIQITVITTTSTTQICTHVRECVHCYIHLYVNPPPVEQCQQSLRSFLHILAPRLKKFEHLWILRASDRDISLRFRHW